MRVEILDRLSHNQHQYQAGDVVELPTEIVKILSENKIVRVVAPDVPEQENPFKEIPGSLKDLTVDEAEPIIAEEENTEVLMRWLEADKRKGIFTAINDRLEELANAEAD